MNHITVSHQFLATTTTVSNLFWDITRWNHIWNPVESVTVFYDDGFNQEFVMSVWREKKLEKIRTLRFRPSRDCIHFFSPNPPPMMVQHTGNWIFSPVNKVNSIVTANRWYEMKRNQNESFSAFSERCEVFAQNFELRLKRILNVFAEHFVEQR